MSVIHNNLRKRAEAFASRRARFPSRAFPRPLLRFSPFCAPRLPEPPRRNTRMLQLARDLMSGVHRIPRTAAEDTSICSSILAAGVVSKAAEREGRLLSAEEARGILRSSIQLTYALIGRRDSDVFVPEVSLAFAEGVFSSDGLDIPIHAAPSAVAVSFSNKFMSLRGAIAAGIRAKDARFAGLKACKAAMVTEMMRAAVLRAESLYSRWMEAHLRVFPGAERDCDEWDEGENESEEWEGSERAGSARDGDLGERGVRLQGAGPSALGSTGANLGPLDCQQAMPKADEVQRHGAGPVEPAPAGVRPLGLRGRGGGLRDGREEAWRASWRFPLERAEPRPANLEQAAKRSLAEALRDPELERFSACSLIQVRAHQDFLKTLWRIALRADAGFAPVLSVIEGLS